MSDPTAPPEPNPPAPQRPQMCPACPNPWPCSVHAYPVAPAPQRPEPVCAECGATEYAHDGHLNHRWRLAPTAPGDAPKRFHSGEQVMEHYVPGYQRPAPEPSPYAPPPEADVEALPPGLLILIDKADDWLEASKLANRDYATEQHGTAADLKRKAFVEFIHASVRENPKTLQTGLSLLRSLSRRLQEAEAASTAYADRLHAECRRTDTLREQITRMGRKPDA